MTLPRDRILRTPSLKNAINLLLTLQSRVIRVARVRMTLDTPIVRPLQ